MKTRLQIARLPHGVVALARRCGVSCGIIVASAAMLWLAGWIALAGVGAGRAFADATTTTAAEWSVREASGTVRARSTDDPAAPWARIATGDAVGAASVVETGADGRAVLVRGEDVIRLAADSQIEVVAPDRDGVSTRILQRSGSAFFEVETRPTWQFQVETPYLVALVKGTRFGVDVTSAGASVSVSEGRVGVSNRGGGVDVVAGQTARASASGGATISVGPTASVTPATPAVPAAPAIPAAPAASGTPSLGATPATPATPASNASAGVAGDVSSTGASNSADAQSNSNAANAGGNGSATETATNNGVGKGIGNGVGPRKEPK